MVWLLAFRVQDKVDFLEVMPGKVKEGLVRWVAILALHSLDVKHWTLALGRTQMVHEFQSRRTGTKWKRFSSAHVVYTDEIVPGNVLGRAARKRLTRYATLAAFQTDLAHEATWLTLSVERSTLVSSAIQWSTFGLRVKNPIWGYQTACHMVHDVMWRCCPQNGLNQ